MASITTEGRSELIALYTAIFNAAPGATNLSEIVLLKESGKSLEEVATFLTGKADFAKVYPALLTADEFAARLVANMLPAETSADATAWASNWVKSQLASGKGAAFVFASAVQAVRSTNNADFKPAKDLLANKVDVSTYFSVTKLLSDPDLLDLQNVLTGVSSSSASVTTAKTAVDAIASAASVVTPVAFPLTTGVESKTLGAGNDTFDSLNSATSTTLNAGDVLVGGDGTDRLAIVSSIANGTLGQGVQTTSVEQLSVNAVGATTVEAATMAGVTDVYNNASLAAVTVNGLNALANVHVLNTNQSTTVTFAAAAVAGAADATTVLLNGAATTASNTVTVEGIETINLVAAGTASGSAAGGAGSTATNTTLTSASLTTLNMTGVTAKVSAGLPGATATVTGTVTSDAGAHDVDITGVVAADKLSVSMNAGNDTVRISDIAATHTINGGDGTDTLVATVAITTVTGANISGFEAVSTGAFAVALPTGNLINAVTFTGNGGSVSTVLSGATVTQAAAGNNTVSNAAWVTGTADALTVNVGSATVGGAVAAGLTAEGIESITINNSTLSTDTTSARALTVTQATSTLKSVIVSGTQPTTLTAAQTTLTSVNAEGVAGGFTFTSASTAGASVTGGVAADVLTGGAGADTLTGGLGNDALVGNAGADVINGGDGADTITGGTGADSMTGGAGADRFVFSANSSTSVVSTSSASDTIADFATGVDKLVGTGAVEFLGAYPNIQTALAAATNSGTNPVLVNTAVFITGESTLYVLANNNGTLNVNDLVIKMPTVTTLSRGDFLLGSQATGNTVALTAPAATATTTTSNLVNVPSTVTTNTPLVTSTVTTDNNDTVNSTVAFAVGSTLTGALGTDTLALSITAAAANGAEGTLSAANLQAVTGFEAITLANFVNTTGIANVYNITIDDDNLDLNSTMTVTSSHTGTLADGTLSAAGVTFNASALTGNRKVVFNGNSAHDVVVGGAGADSLVGGAGNDTITGGAGVDTLSGGDGNDTIIVNADVTATGGYSFAGSGGVADVFQVGVGGVNRTIDLTGNTFGTFEVLDMATNVAVNTVTLTQAQLKVFTDLGTGGVTGNGGNDVIVVSTAGAVSADADIGSFSVLGGSSVTVLAAGQIITEVTNTSTVANADVSTVTIGALTMTGTLTGFDSTDKLVLNTGANIASLVNTAAATGGTLDMNEVTITGAVTMTEAQHDGLIAASATAAILAGGAADQITISGAAVTIVADADIETYVITDAAANAPAVSNITGGQSVTGTAGTDAVTVSISGTYTGTLTGEATTADVVSLATGANIAGATVGAGFVALTIASGGSVTMTAAQYSGFTGTTTAAGAETVTLTTAGTLVTSATMDAAVETINLATGTNSLTLAGTTAHTIVGGTGADTITITTGTTAVNQTINFGVDVATDRISVNNPGVVVTETKNATISNFNVAHDAIKTLLAGTSTTSGTFNTIASGSNTAIAIGATLAGSIIEITGTNLVNLADTANAGTVEAAIIGALGTVTGLGADRTYTVALYGGGDAGIYQVTLNGADGGGGADDIDDPLDFQVEHLITLTGVAADALVSANFYA